MKFRIAVSEITRVYYEIEAADEAVALDVVNMLNADQLDIDDVGELVSMNDSYSDGSFELTGWVDEDYC